MIGTSIGQFVLKRKLGEGAMGSVFLAEHAILRSPRALKILLPEWTKNREIVQRFINEARAAASIKHRNIVEVHDCGELPSGQWYIVLDYVEGKTLGDFIDSHRGPVPIHDTLHVIAEVANGLQAAHDHNIIHRDLKPENIYLAVRDGDRLRAIILDFGVAKLGEEMGGSATRTGAMIGTPAFMAPEQLRGAKVTHAIDVYALGVVTYCMVTGGWLPYQDEAEAKGRTQLPPAEIYHRQMTGRPIDPRRFCPGLPELWVQAIYAALEIDPAKRPATARAFALRLAEATAPDSMNGDGLTVLRTYAPELLQLTDDNTNRHNVRAATQPSVSATASKSAPRYQLGARLGIGGMAEVFAGTMLGAEGFARPVAIKRVLAGFSQRDSFAAMFIEEARVVSQLSHPNVVSVFDFDRDPEGRLFLAMELVEGTDLAKLMHTGELPASVTIFLISEILSGLGYAHERPRGELRGIVHRDVSPQNVLVSWEGAVKVSDFGIAKALSTGVATATDVIKGKPAYMSPEQANGEPLDARSDLWAVGAILWEILAKDRLFSGTAHEIVAQILFRPLLSPSAHRARKRKRIPSLPKVKIPADLEAVAMKLIEREPRRRYSNADAALADLARCQDSPRQGRLELARLLAERFAAESSGRATRTPVAMHVQPPPVPLQPAPPPQPLRTISGEVVGTIGRSSGQDDRQRARPAATTGRRTVAVGIVVVAVLVSAAVAVVAIAVVTGGSKPAAVDAVGVKDLAATARPKPVAAAIANAGTPGASSTSSADKPAAPRTDAAVAAAADPSTPDADATPAATAAKPVPSAPPPKTSGPPDPVPTPAGKARGKLTIRVRPWANVWINGKPYGQTPVQVELPVGRHRVRLRDEATEKSLTVTVTAGQPMEVNQQW
jgi:serine/threonine protein kinase